MAKVFEDYFSGYQTEMLAMCLEYVNYDVDKVFLYCSSEEGVQMINFFFEIDGRYYRKYELEMSGKKYDTSMKRISAYNRRVIATLLSLDRKCEEFNRPMPTEMKIVYDVKKNSVDANYRYDLMYSNDPERLPEHIFEEWFEEVKKTEK